jgi:hypothetical protein
VKERFWEQTGPGKFEPVYVEYYRSVKRAALSLDDSAFRVMFELEPDEQTPSELRALARLVQRCPWPLLLGRFYDADDGCMCGSTALCFSLGIVADGEQAADLQERYEYNEARHAQLPEMAALEAALNIMELPCDNDGALVAPSYETYADARDRVAFALLCDALWIERPDYDEAEHDAWSARRDLEADVELRRLAEGGRKPERKWRGR